ncbi:MAG TPA: hypothetical protein VFC82_05980 [Actinomycetaceae bacterium]|nr:hypothetical protein [Actinomycetaceae bacterium]
MTETTKSSWAGRIGSIGAATLTASVLGFILLALVARILTPDQNAAFLSIWGLVFAFGSIISSSEQEVARQSTVAHLAGRKVPGGVVQVAGFVLSVSLIGVLVLAALPAGSALFAGSVELVVLTIVCVSGLAGQFFWRGVFLGISEIHRYVGVIIMEALLRVGFALAFLLLLDSAPLSAPVAAVAVGCFAWVPFSFSKFRVVEWRGSFDPWAEVLRNMGPLALATGLSAVVLTAYPSLVTSILGDSRGLATLFGVVTLTRVPIVLMTPFQALTVPITTRLVTEGRTRELSGMQVKLALGATALAVVIGVGGYLLGPWGMRVFMGPQYDASGALVATLLASSVYIAAALMQAAVCVALQRYSLVLGVWIVSVAAAVVTLVTVPGSNEIRGMWGFVAASFAAYFASTFLLRRAIRHRVTGDATAKDEAGRAGESDRETSS